MLAHIILFFWNLCKHGGKQVFKNWGLIFHRDKNLQFSISLAFWIHTIHHLEYVSRTKSILFGYYIQACTGMWLYKHENVECWTTKKSPSKWHLFNLKNVSRICEVENPMLKFPPNSICSIVQKVNYHWFTIILFK